MLVAPDEFLGRYPEFNPVELGLIASILEESEEDCPVNIWGSKLKPNRLKRAVMLLTAHRLASRWIQIGELASQAASVASGTTSAVSQPTTTVPGQIPDLDGTEYGRQLMLMRSQVATTGFVF